MKRTIIVLFILLVSVLCIYLHFNRTEDVGHFLNQQIGKAYEPHTFSNKLGDPIGRFSRNDGLEYHYDFKLFKESIYKKEDIVGVVVRTQDGKVTSWDNIY